MQTTKQILTALLLTLCTQLLPAAAAPSKDWDFCTLENWDKCPSKNEVLAKLNSSAPTLEHVEIIIKNAARELTEYNGQPEERPKWSKLIAPAICALEEPMTEQVAEKLREARKIVYTFERPGMLHHINAYYIVLKDYINWGKQDQLTRQKNIQGQKVLLRLQLTNMPDVLTALILEYCQDPITFEKVKALTQKKSSCVIS